RPDAAGDAGQGDADVARLALDVGAEVEDAVAELLGPHPGGGQGAGVVGQDVVVDVGGQRLQRLRHPAGGPLPQVVQDVVGHAWRQVIAIQHGQGVGERRRIGGGGAGGDDVERVADHVEIGRAHV